MRYIIGYSVLLLSAIMILWFFKNIENKSLQKARNAVTFYEENYENKKGYKMDTFLGWLYIKENFQRCKNELSSETVYKLWCSNTKIQSSMSMWNVIDDFYSMGDKWKFLLWCLLKENETQICYKWKSIKKLKK